MAMTHKNAHPDFIRCAFDQPTTVRLHFMFPLPLGGSPHLGDTRNIPLNIFSAPGGLEAFRVMFEGLDVLVSNIRGDAPQMAEIRF
jgi:hypothetical protein